MLSVIIRGMVLPILAGLTLLAPRHAGAMVRHPTFFDSISKPSSVALALPQTPEYAPLQEETPEGLCRNDPVNSVDPLGLWGVQVGRLNIGIGHPTLAFGNPGYDVGDASFSRGWEEGRIIAANELTFGRYDTLNSDAQALIAQGGVYQASALSARLGRSALLAAGTATGVGAVSTVASGGGAAATVAKGALTGFKLVTAGVSANSAGQNLGQASVEFENGDYKSAALHGTLGLVDAYSAMSGGLSAAGDINAGARSLIAAKSVPSGQFYSTAFQTELKTASYPGMSRAAHFQEANQALLTSMEADAQFAQSMRNIGINQERTPTGLAPRQSPAGWTWHHAPESGVMELVPRPQHAPGSIFQETLHPGGQGGFSIWGQ